MHNAHSESDNWAFTTYSTDEIIAIFLSVSCVSNISQNWIPDRECYTLPAMVLLQAKKIMGRLLQLCISVCYFNFISISQKFC